MLEGDRCALPESTRQRRHSKFLSFFSFISFRNASSSEMASHHGQGYLYPHGAFTGAMVSKSDYVYRVWRELSLCFCTGHQPQYRRRLKQDILRYRAHRHCWTQGPLSTVRTIHCTIPSYIPSSAEEDQPGACSTLSKFPEMQRTFTQCVVFTVCMPACCQNKGIHPHPATRHS